MSDAKIADKKEMKARQFIVEYIQLYRELPCKDVNL